MCFFVDLVLCDERMMGKICCCFGFVPSLKLLNERGMLMLSHEKRWKLLF